MFCVKVLCPVKELLLKGENMNLTKKLLSLLIFLIICLVLVLNKDYIRENVKFRVFQKQLNALSYHDFKSIDTAQNLLLEYIYKSNSQKLRDKAFEIYRVKFFKTLRHSEPSYRGLFIWSCGAVSSKQSPEIKKYLSQMGLKLMSSEGCFYAEEDNKFTLQTFGRFLSPSWRTYLALRNSERNIYLKSGFLAIPWDELRERIIFWEEFLKKYPNFPENKEIKAKLADYAQCYIEGRYYPGDVLKPDLKASYEYFISNNENSKYHRIVSKWYRILKKDKFVYPFSFKGNRFIRYDANNKTIKIKQPYKVLSYNHDIYDGTSP